MGHRLEEVNVSKLYRNQTIDRVLHTAEFQSNGDREAVTALERARVGDALVDAETHLLLGD